MGFEHEDNNTLVEILDNGIIWELRLVDKTTKELIDMFNLQYHFSVNSIHPSHFDKIITQDGEPRETLREFLVEHFNIEKTC
jgi:hypothetical protein